MAQTYAATVSVEALEYVRQARIAIIKALESLDGTEHPADRNGLFTAYDRLGEINIANE